MRSSFDRLSAWIGPHRTLAQPAVMFVLLATFAAGCGRESDGWNRAAVKGTITLDGKPLEQGTITFFPAGTPGTAAGGKISNGKYSIPAVDGPVVGLNRVEIRSVQKTGRLVLSPEAPLSDTPPPPEGQMVEEFLEVVPDRYNNQSILKKDVRGDSENSFDFTLSSKPEE